MPPRRSGRRVLMRASSVFDEIMEESLIDAYRTNRSDYGAYVDRLFADDDDDASLWADYHNGDYEFNLWLGELIGNVEVGVDNIHTVTSSVHQQQQTAITEEEETCPICLDTMTAGQTPVRQTNLCKHTFCEPCITKWLQKSKKCPVCMQTLE